MLPWIFSRKGASGFSWASTADQVTAGISASGLTAIVTGTYATRLHRPLCTSSLSPPFDFDDWIRSCCLPLTARGVERDRRGDGAGAGGARGPRRHGRQEPRLRRHRAPGRPRRDPRRQPRLELDLSSLASVRKFAADFAARGLPLNILINNAGVMATPFSLSKDGIEMQFATNHVGHFLLTQLLLETMKKTSRESNVEGRIVNVSSEGHRFAYKEGIRFAKLNDEEEYSTIAAYGQSKLANILHANELARRFKEEGVNITANSLHPGSIITNLLRHHSIIDVMSRTLGKLVLKNVQQGAATQCYVALHPGAKGVSGKYWSDSNLYEPSAKAKDAELGKKLWDYTLNLVAA